MLLKLTLKEAMKLLAMYVGEDKACKLVYSQVSLCTHYVLITANQLLGLVLLT